MKIIINIYNIDSFINVDPFFDINEIDKIASIRRYQDMLYHKLVRIYPDLCYTDVIYTAFNNVNSSDGSSNWLAIQDDNETDLDQDYKIISEVIDDLWLNAEWLMYKEYNW